MKKLLLAGKKITAIAASVAMVTSAAFAGGLSSFPGNYVVNEEFVGQVVVGDNAAADQAAAVKLISDLEARYSGDTVQYTITAYKTSESSGDEVAIVDSGTDMNYGEDLNDVRTSAFDDSDSDVLEDDSVKFKSTEDYEQSITMSNNGVFEYALRDDLDSEISSHIFFEKGNILVYQLELDSSVDMDDLDDDDIVGKEITIMGNEFTIADDYSKEDTDADGTTDEGLDKLKLIGGANKITLGQGETVTVDGHTVKVISLDEDEVMVEIDGSSTTIDKYDGETINGVSIAVTGLIDGDNSDGYAEIVVGGQEILLEDGSEIKVNDEDISDLVDDYKVTVAFDNTGGAGWDGFTITYEWDNSDGFMLEEGDSFDDEIFQAFSIVFEGTNDVEYSVVTLESSGESVKLSGETVDEEDYSEEIAQIYDKTAADSPVNLIGGDDNVPMFVSDITFGAGVNLAAATDNAARLADTSAAVAGTEYVVYEEDGTTAAQFDADEDRVVFFGTGADLALLFDLSAADVNVDGINSAQSDDGIRFLTGDSDNQKIYEVTGYDDSDDEFDFEDILSGSTKTEVKETEVGAKLDDVTFTAADAADLISEIKNDETTLGLAFANEIMVDLTDVPNFDVDDSTVLFTYDTGDMTEDTAGDAKDITIVFGDYDTTDDEFTLSLTTTDFQAFAGYSGAEFDVADNDDDTVERVNAYGTKVVYDAEDKLKVEIYTPDEQVEAEVNLVFGEAGSKTYETFTVTEDAKDDKVTELEADGYTIDSVVEVSEDVVFDLSETITAAEVVSNENLIVVGGPAVNAVARDLLGITTYDISQAGVNPGEGVIKYYEDENTILVYGYEAADTTKAVEALIAGGLSGDEESVQ